tara:strand:+ start:70 stop:549 length:480 start_codon:yes stop_codon:yes gene_type:complete
MNDECLELKNIKYKSMLLTGNIEEKKETVENLSNLDVFLEDEKKNISNEPWTKLDKTTKLIKINDFVNEYSIEQNYSELSKNDLMDFLSITLDRKRLLKSKEVLYNKESGKITSIPSLIYNSTSKKFTLKRCDKRPSTLKSLAPKKNKNKKNDKIDINN